MKLISLFSGIGGFELAGEWAGWQNVVSCEINPFGRKVLEYYWPNAYHHDDIKTLTFEKIDYELTQRFGAKWNADDIILTGGFPCQPYSAAGKRLGKEDERHLWPEMRRIIREVQPKWVVGENVLGLVNWSDGLVFEEVQADLESEGYEIQPFILPAASVNAPHKRDRVWFVAYRNGTGLQKERAEQQTAGIEQYRELEQSTPEPCNTGSGPAPDTDSTNNQTRTQRKVLGQPNRKKTDGFGNVECRTQWENFPTQSPIRTGNDGLPTELDGITFSKWRNESIKAGGNAIVPQVVYQIFKAINEYQTNTQKP
jgi:DNA (cytosine-5)-methyltransferase 1